ncbi:PDZ domain-containing protein [Homoserinibacter sp. GY 40078]|nr:PDZ domain-containing protein [Homoserinibacter sp. GY 40078]
MPSPFVIERPGPVYDTLGTTTVDGDDVPVIEITGTETFPTKGRLDLLTVYLDGTRESPIDWFSVASAWFDSNQAIIPVDQVFPAGQTDEEADQESAIDMQVSQQEAVAAALSQLDIPFTAKVAVGAVTTDGPSDGVLLEGDIVLEIGGASIATEDELREAIAASTVGEPLAIVVDRDGSERDLEVTPQARSAEDAGPVLGIYPITAYTFPFQVDIGLQDVGGPSAGTMFALAIYDKLTPGPLVGGEHVAGTGTISADGTVGPIGGIRQKMIGARDAGADWFLAPSANCDEVVGHVPNGLTVFAVDTFDDAVDLVTAIGDGGSTSAFASCEG